MTTPSNLERPAFADRPTRTRVPRGLVAVSVLAFAVLSLWAVPAGFAAPVPSAAMAPQAAPATDSWAWGALDNTTLSLEHLGAYADVLNLTGGNLSAASAFVAEVGYLHAETGAFAVLNVTATSASTLALEATAVSVANDTGYLGVAGTLPAAGTYAPGGPVTLQNESSVYAAHMEEISAYAVFANYTVSNRSLALANEQVEAWTGVNITLVAVNWPTYTTDANGSTTVTYTTAVYAELAWVAEVVRVNFTPALPIAQFPLAVGENWTAATSAQIIGWAAYANDSAASVNGQNATQSHAGSASLNTTAALTVAFDVVGSQRVVFPNGTEVTGYTVVPTVNGGTAGAYTLWDGLVLLPVSPGTTPPAPAPSARPLATVAAAPAGAPASAATVDPTTGLPVSVSTTSATGSSVTTAPVTPATATSHLATTTTPSKPVTAPATPSTNPVAPTGGSPTSTPPTSAPTTSSAKSGVDPALLAAVVAVIVGAFLAVALVRERRRR